MDEADLLRVLSCLSEGEQNAISTESLTQKTGLNRRALQQAIHDLRMQGHLICSRTDRGGGYWISGDQTELQTFVGSMDRRARATFAAVSSARKAIKKE